MTDEAGRPPNAPTSAQDAIDKEDSIKAEQANFRSKADNADKIADTTKSRDQAKNAVKKEYIDKQ